MKLAIRIPRLADSISWLLLTFLVLFPKGGIKPADIPVTWGYVILAAIFFPLALIRILNGPFRSSPLTLAAFASLLPFQIVLLYSFAVNGQTNLAISSSYVISLIFMPAIFLGVLPSYLRFVNFEKFRRHFCFCVLAAAIWGIFLFFYHPIMGHYIEIPYFTVNAGDYGLLETTKNIDRGGYLKLISTYNNGNLYGVATFILFPLYLLLEPKRWKRNVVRIALCLTLSRTIWVGLIFEQMLSLSVKIPHIFARFPRIRPGKALPQLVAVSITFGLIVVGLFFSGKGLSFLFDSSLGGREGSLYSFVDPTLLPVVPVATFSELLYASSLARFGIVGFLAVMLIYAAPVLLLLWKPWLLRFPVRRAAAKGLILYAFIASLDNAVLLIPVMAFYFFVYMVMLHGLPGEAQLAPASLDNRYHPPQFAQNPPHPTPAVAID